jgi:hypothetical protein
MSSIVLNQVRSIRLARKASRQVGFQDFEAAE